MAIGEVRILIAGEGHYIVWNFCKLGTVIYYVFRRNG